MKRVNKKSIKKSVTVTVEEQAAIDRLRDYTRSSTDNKAMLIAITDYVIVCRERDQVIEDYYSQKTQYQTLIGLLKSRKELDNKINTIMKTTHQENYDEFD